jgi:hypothetical protein
LIPSAWDVATQGGPRPDGLRNSQIAKAPHPFGECLVVAAKKRSAKASRQFKPRQVTDKPWLILSAAAGSLFNMTVTAVTSGSALLCFFAAKRFL